VKTLIYLPKDFNDSARVFDVLERWNISSIVSARSPTPPMLEAFAQQNHIECSAKKPNFKRYGRTLAYGIYEQRMVEASEMCIIFEKLGDKAAKRILRLTGENRIPCHVIHLRPTTAEIIFDDV
jgi:hypothetical protein